MQDTIQQLVEESQIKLKGLTPLNDAESNRVRYALASRLGLPGNLFDSVKDELRVLQRSIVVQLAKDSNGAKGAAVAAAAPNANEATALGDDKGELSELAMLTARGAPGMPEALGKAAAEAAGRMPSTLMATVREAIMEMQGARPGSAR